MTIFEQIKQMMQYLEIKETNRVPFPTLTTPYPISIDYKFEEDGRVTAIKEHMGEKSQIHPFDPDVMNAVFNRLKWLCMGKLSEELVKKFLQEESWQELGFDITEESL